MYDLTAGCFHSGSFFCIKPVIMKKLLNAALLLTSLIGYLEWGGGNSEFLFQIEYDLIFGALKDPNNFKHPFVLLPMLGQALILITLFQKTPGRTLTLIGLACMSLLMLFILLSGVLGMNVRVVLSTLPFVITGIFVVRAHWKRG